MTLTALRSHLSQQQDQQTADDLARFFKTGPGEYADGDKFLGIKVPVLRSISKQFKHLDVADLQLLIDSPFHEERMLALLILMHHYQRATTRRNRAQCYAFYVANKAQINNWDLVDVSAPHIVGHYLFDKNADVLKKWAKQDHLWTRRIAMVATFYFIRQSRFDDTLQLAEILLADSHDLIHKATGWMLREVGKRDVSVLETFLQQHYRHMPRTMLRYAIEKFPETKRQAYLRDKKRTARPRRI